MAILQCAISGLTIKCTHVPIAIYKNIGYYHPIFAIDQKQLDDLYQKYLKRHLTPEDSYLLFLAYLHSTGKVEWQCPMRCNPKTKTIIYIVENYIKQLIKVIEQSNFIQHPAFKQPSFVVNKDTCSLSQLPAWIQIWEDNINEFKAGYIRTRIREHEQSLENKLTKIINSDKHPKEYIRCIAEWAAVAGDFPEQHRKLWKNVIAACYNETKISPLHYPSELIQHIQEYCIENIMYGSVHQHTLLKALAHGIKLNKEYLGEIIPVKNNGLDAIARIRALLNKRQNEK